MIVVPRLAMVGIKDRCAAADEYRARNQALQVSRRLHHGEKLLIPPLQLLTGHL